ncbi:hypothetical protein GCM10023169_39130 [Georgenia halophila]|uniref:ABC-2 type transport system permease protein n=1 Tax=Georgenia halophila TaxID=620889 RepID=A0ABP8LPH6_9MICO
MRLLKVELRRLFSRRLVIAAMLAGLVGAGLVLFGFFQTSQPMSETEREQAEQYWQQARADWEQHGEENIAQCLEQEEAESERAGEDLDFGCDQMAPQREHFFFESPPLEETLPRLLSSSAPIYLLVGFFVGGTFTAAAASTGALGTWLTFEPRRTRVYASKVLAAGLGILPAAAVLLGVVVGGAWLIGTGFDTAGGMTAEHWESVAWTALRLLALTGVTAALGAVLGLLLRHTAAVLGAVAGWGVAVEAILGQQVDRLAPWILSTNIIGWINHGTTYDVRSCTTDAQGMMCEYEMVDLAFAHSAVYLGVVAVGLTVLGLLVFRRRDL